MKILITGGLGFIGSNLVQLLIKKKSIKKIIIVDNFSKTSLSYIELICKFKFFEQSSGFKSTKDRIVVIKEDIKNYKFALNITKNIDCIIHLAAESGIDVSISSPKKSFDTNVIGTFNYLEAARNNNVKLFIFASSGAVFGITKPPMKENFPRLPISPYGSSKLSIESFCETYSNVFNINTTILRFSNAYGLYSSHKKSVVANFIKNIINNKIIYINGNGKQTRDYIFAEDVVNGIYKSILNSKKSRTYHIATGKETSVNNLIKKLISTFNKTKYAIPEIINTEGRRGDIKHNCLSIAHSKKNLNWSNITVLDKGLKKTINWFLSVKIS